jgi:hypothetical protein
MTEYQNDNYHQSLLVPYHQKIYESDKIVIKKHTNKMINKTDKHVKETIYNIRQLKAGACKKYQISGYHEYKLLAHMLAQCQCSDVEYQLIQDDILKKHVVSCIKGSYSTGCCYDCDGTIKYEHKVVPVLYIQVRNLNKSHKSQIIT